MVDQRSASEHLTCMGLGTGANTISSIQVLTTLNVSNGFGAELGSASARSKAVVSMVDQRSLQMRATAGGWDQACMGLGTGANTISSIQVLTTLNVSNGFGDIDQVH
jgi:cell division protein ZapA (FtsZ GTPase activity inhibitor)